MTDESGYKVTRLDPNKDYSAEIEWSKKIKVGPYEETQVIYGEGCMTNTPDFPALVELASRLEGKDKKTCELALYTLKKQDERIDKLRDNLDYCASQGSKHAGDWFRQNRRITELENTLKDIWDGCVHEDLSHQQIAYKAIAALADGYDEP